MNTRFHFQDINKNDEKQIRDYLTDKKMERLERLLHCADPGTCQFALHAKHFKHKNLFSVKLELDIGGKKLVAEGDSHRLLETFDPTFDRLVFQLRKLEEVKHDK